MILSSFSDQLGARATIKTTTCLASNKEALKNQNQLQQPSRTRTLPKRGKKFGAKIRNLKWRSSASSSSGSGS